MMSLRSLMFWKKRLTGEHQRFPKREDGVDKIEAHVAGVCVRRTNEGWEVLVAKRQSTRSLFPGKWECGGGQLRRGEGFPAALQRQFFQEFGIQVEPLHPLTTYEIHRSRPEELIPGVRFLCEARDGEVSLNKGEFSEYRWIKLPVDEELDWIGGIREVLDMVSLDVAASGMDLPLRVIASLSDEARDATQTCLLRYRDRDFDGAITAICGVVDGLTDRLYTSHGLVDNRDDGFHQRVGKAVKALEPVYRAALNSVEPGNVKFIWNNYRGSISQAANVLGAFRREFSDTHGAQRAGPVLVQRAIDCAIFIAQGLSERR